MATLRFNDDSSTGKDASSSASPDRPVAETPAPMCHADGEPRDAGAADRGTDELTAPRINWIAAKKLMEEEDKG